MPSEKGRSSGSMIAATLAAAAVVALTLPLAMAQAPTKSGTAQDSAVKTPWGEPDLQGIWTDETDTPCNVRRNMQTRSFSHRHSGKN